MQQGVSIYIDACFDEWLHINLTFRNSFECEKSKWHQIVFKACVEKLFKDRNILSKTRQMLKSEYLITSLIDNKTGFLLQKVKSSVLILKASHTVIMYVMHVSHAVFALRSMFF